MMFFRRYISYTLLLVALMLVSCHKKEDDNPKYRQTVIVYMMAENSLSSFVQSDLNEMVRATDSIPEDCRMVVYLDNASATSAPCLLEVANNQSVTIKTYTEQNSCDADVFASVIKDITKEYPSDEYSLVMWSHASGWIPDATPSSAKAPMHKTVGIDNNKNSYDDYGSEMEISAMREAIEKTGVHFNCIMFDACFMQCIEVAYELRNCADYIIGSPAEIPADGAPYDKIMSNFFEENEYSGAISLAQNYYNYYKNGSGMLISVINTSQLDNLAAATATCLPTPPTVETFSGVQHYCSWSDISNWYPDFYDMASLMNSLVGASAYATWKKAMEKAVPLRLYTSTWTSEYSYAFTPKISDSEHYAGVSMFLPAEKYESYGYNSAIKNTQWWQNVWE